MNVPLVPPVSQGRLNPFFQRGPIRNPDDLFGRTAEVEQGLSLLENGQSLSIVGPRRIGKTSLLLFLSNPAVWQAYGLAPRQNVFVYADAGNWHCLPTEEIYAAMVEGASEAMTAAGYLQEWHVDERAPGSFRAVQKLARAVAAQGVHIVFLLDEFESLAANPYLDASFFSGLRGLATSHGVSYITASRQPLLALYYAHENSLSSPFFNFFAQIRLGLFSFSTSEGMLREMAGRVGGAFHQSTTAWLLEMAGPHPLLLQIAGYHAFAALGADGLPLDAATRERVRRAFISEAEAHWTYYWRGLPPAEQRLLALLPVAAGADPEGVQRLQQKGLVYLRDGALLTLSPAFREFVSRQPVEGLMQIPPITIDVTKRVVLLHTRPLQLSPTEFALLAFLAAHPDEVLTREQLVSQLWKGPAEPDPDYERLKAAVKQLRRSLGEDSHCIENERGIGYRFVPLKS